MCLTAQVLYSTPFHSTPPSFRKWTSWTMLVILSLRFISALCHFAVLTLVNNVAAISLLVLPATRNEHDRDCRLSDDYLWWHCSGSWYFVILRDIPFPKIRRLTTWYWQNDIHCPPSLVPADDTPLWAWYSCAGFGVIHENRLRIVSFCLRADCRQLLYTMLNRRDE